MKSLFLALCTLSLGAALAAQTAVSNTTYVSGQVTSVTGPTTLTAGTAVTVNAGATVTYYAGTVTLSPGFTAATGSSFRAVGTGGMTTYTVTVVGGSGGGAGFPAGAVLSVSGTGAGTFSGWTIVSGTGTFGDTNAATTTFTVGSGDVTIRANYIGSPDDVDDDGLPNSWEQTHFGSSTAADPKGDPDGDGLTNAAEYNLGKNPNAYDQSTSTLGNDIPAGWPNADANANLPVGATAGTLQVDKNGAATYSVPLWVTPGTAGMQPQLALNYSSQAGAGWLGFGWSLGGVSAITRGPQTLAVDNQIKGMNFSATDRFYMDGQRLIYVAGTGSGYGTDGAEYRTEIDSVSKIVSYGSAGSGPMYFKVWTKAGLIIEFGNAGNNSGASVEAQGRSEVANWAVSKISDTKGNYMTFEYYEDSNNGEHRLTRINYTGNTGVSPYASVRFTYEARTDTFAGYVAGSKISRTQRLKKIGSYFGETLAREYTLDYIERANTGRSILTTIREKGNDGREYSPLTFSYEQPQAGWGQIDNLSWGAPLELVEKDAPPRGTGFVDVNGDGRPDFVKFHRANGTNTTGAWLNDPVSGWVWAPQFTPPAALAEDGVTDTGARFVDVDGDGLTDFVRNGVVHLNNGAGWTHSPTWSFDSIVNEGYFGIWEVIPNGGFFADLNADGRPDFMGVSRLRYEYNDQWFFEEKVTVYLNTGSGWVRSQDHEIWMDQIEIPMGSGNWRLADRDCLQKGVRFMDVNGDGLPDFVQNYNDSGNIKRRVALNSGTGFFEQAANSPFMPPKLFATGGGPVGTEVVDLNGDGLPDLLYNGNNDGLQNVAYLNTGNGWLYAPAYLSPHVLWWDNASRGVAFLDVNGDGAADLVKGWEDSSFPDSRDTRLSTGNGWSASVPAHNIARQMSQGGLRNTGTDYVDLNADGLIDQVWNLNWGGSITKGAAFNLSRGSDRLVSVTNGFNVTASLAYAPLTERDSSGNYTVYTKGTSVPNADTANLIGPMYVVKTVTHDDGAGGQYSLTYRYGELRAHRLRGSLGFGWMQVTDNRTSITSNTAFRQDFPFVGMPYDTETRTSGNVVLSESAVTYDLVSGSTAGTYLPYAKNTTETSRDLNNAVITTTTTSIDDIDIYGNVKLMSVSTSDGFTKTTTNTYDNDATTWKLGRLRTANVASTGPAGHASVTRNSSFTYNNEGLLETEKVQPGDPTYELTTTYGYDQFGNKTNVTVSGPNLSVDGNGNYGSSGTVSRSTSTVYDSNGRFPTSTTNALGHSESYTGYDQVLGVLTQLTGANGLVTSWEYDGFGRKKKETRADSTISEIRYKWAAAGSPAGSLYLVETESTGAPPSLAFYDKFGRAIHALGINGDGRIVYQTTSYDLMGRAYAKSNPYFNDGSTVYWSQTTSFDLLNRPLTVTTPDDQNGTQTTTYTYEGLSTKATDPKGRVAATVKNSQGWTTYNSRNFTGIASTAPSNVSYYYDAIGNLTSTVAEGVTTTLTYDIRGRKTSMTDADMGTWHYRYNAFGELVWQKDAKGQVVTMSYDALGRMTQRVEPEGTTTWTYDTAAKPNGTWKGKLAGVSAPGSYSESYTYDSLGRPQSASRTIDGTTYTVETAYDSAGRVIRTKYPATGIGSGPVSTRNVYNGFGYLKEIRNWLDSDTGRLNSQLQGLVYWRVADGTSSPAYNSAGAIEAEEYGNGLANDRYYSRATGRLLTASIDSGFNVNGPYRVQQLAYSYDGVGNVTRRNDLTPGFERDERFEDYDALDRLRSSRIEGVSGSTVTVAYDSKGNITSKSDVGSYTYSGYGPHAVSQAGVNSYSYDAVGNMLTGNSRYFGWTSFNQMRWVLNGAGQSSEFFFGAGHERVKQIRRTGSAANGGVVTGTVTDTTIYVGSLYEKVTTAATNTVEHKHYIMAPTGRIAVVTQSTVNGTIQANTTRYFHTDGLGSITVVSDEAGRVLKRYAYDAWGKQSTRYTNTANGITNQAPTTRGFTDHEMLSDFGLIHMNGRVYDPVLGRFLSADPYVGNPSDSQDYNRYSYVGNNPLSHIDPSGYFKLGDALKIVAVVVVAVVATIVTYGAATGVWTTMGGVMSAAAGGSSAAIGAMAAGGFASGFAGSLLNGGSIGDAFKSGVIGGLAAGLGAWASGASSMLGQMGAQAVIQGAAAEASGGEFRHGFIAGLATGVMAPSIGAAAKQNWVAGMIIQALVGGTASQIGGGKFANGAFAAATYYALSSPPTRSQLSPSNVAKGVGVAGKIVIDRVIGENYGAAWRSMFTEKWVNGPTGGKLPQSLADGMKAVGASVPADAAANGMHAWHAGSNAYLAGKLGLIGAPALFAGGLFHESPFDWGSFQAEQQFQGTVNHVLDSTMDIVANVFGMGVGYLNPGVGVDDAVKWGNYIPGPGEPDPAFGGGGPYKGNPADAWGQYPKYP